MSMCAGCGRPVNQWRCPFCGTWNETGGSMTMPEIIALARRMVREVVNGWQRAVHWLTSLHWDFRVIAAIVGRRGVAA